MKNKKGFTLIELLAVIVVLAIIIIIAIINVNKQINKTRKKANDINKQKDDYKSLQIMFSSGVRFK